MFLYKNTLGIFSDLSKKKIIQLSIICILPLIICIFFYLSLDYIHVLKARINSLVHQIQTKWDSYQVKDKYIVLIIDVLIRYNLDYV